MNAETRVFRINNDVSIETIVSAIDEYCKSKQMQTQYSQTPDGSYVLQATQDSVWKIALGMRVATTVQISQIEDMLNVSIGAGEWADKIGSAAIGLFIAWPLLVTAGYGAYMQKKLPGEIFTVINNTIQGMPVTYNSGMSGSFYNNQATEYRQFNQGQSTVYSQYNSQQSTMIPCPQCSKPNTGDAKFCQFCGTPLKIVCSNCGKELTADTKFCSNCGTKVN